MKNKVIRGVLAAACVTTAVSAANVFGAGTEQSLVNEASAVTKEETEETSEAETTDENTPEMTETETPDSTAENAASDLPAAEVQSGKPEETAVSVQAGSYYPWVNENGIWYFKDPDGTIVKGAWREYDKNRYYLNNDGKMAVGWKKLDGSWYYFQSWGGVYRDAFYTVKNVPYYSDADGKMATGWKLIDDVYYYFDDQGAMYRNHFFEYDKNTYYVDADGKMASGFEQIDGIWYYFRSWGGMYKNAFITYDNNLYYLGSDSKMAIGWQSIGGNTYYFRNWGGMITGKQVIDGKTYVFDEDGKLVQSPDGFEPSAQIGVRTVRNFLKNALLPLGNTLYIWGGGHTDAEAESYGVNAQWKQFFNTQNSTYNYSDHLYEYGKGLDCSGYVGWTAHQVTKEYATTTSTGMPAYFARKGWGTCVTGDTSQKFTPGDVVSKSGHVWIVIGQCSDGSVVVIHATPPYIQLGGTVSSTGSINSEAIELANEYMKMYYPVAYERYGVKVLDRSYLTGVNHFTWSSSILSDSEGYRRKKPAEILNDLFQ